VQGGGDGRYAQQIHWLSFVDFWLYRLAPVLFRPSAERHDLIGLSLILAWILLTGGLVLLGVLYDFWTLNSQVSEENRSRGGR
jgi:hypothetical protein